jgi:hypothetical protein
MAQSTLKAVAFKDDTGWKIDIGNKYTTLTIDEIEAVCGQYNALGYYNAITSILEEKFIW